MAVGERGTFYKYKCYEIINVMGPSILNVYEMLDQSAKSKYEKLNVHASGTQNFEHMW